MKVLWEVQTPNLFFENFNIFGVYFSCSRWKSKKMVTTFETLTQPSEIWRGQNLLNCIIYLPVTSPFRKVSVHSRQSEHVCRICPLWSDRFSLKTDKVTNYYSKLLYGDLLFIPLCFIVTLIITIVITVLLLIQLIITTHHCFWLLLIHNGFKCHLSAQKQYGFPMNIEP